MTDRPAVDTAVLVGGTPLFDIERQINGQDAGQRRAVRQELSAPLVAEL